MPGLHFNTNTFALPCVALLLLSALVGSGSHFSEHVASTPELIAPSGAQTGCALLTRCAVAEMQQLRSSDPWLAIVESPATPTGYDRYDLANDAHAGRAPTLHSQAIRLQI